MRKAQSAIEFSMTYGWAILVMLVGISALAYFGVFSDKMQTERCQFSSGITCKEYAITSNGINSNLTLIIQNSVGEPITINSVNVSGESQTGNCNPTPIDITADSTQHFECQFNKFTSKSIKFTSTIVYKKVQGDYNHSITGDIVVNT